MPRVVFTSNLQRHISAPPQEAAGETVRAVLDAAFLGNDRLRSYVLDEQGALREHMLVFVDGTPIRDRRTLSDNVPAAGEVYVMQALSGG
jgi:sulfur-carrier protein